MINIEPHGGRLINCEVGGEERETLKERSLSLRKIALNSRQISDLEMISVGAFSPLEGFMSRSNYESVVQNMRLVDGLIWTIPITLSVGTEIAAGLEEGEELLLCNTSGDILAILELEEKFHFDWEREALQVYGTIDQKHPGVNYLVECGEILLAGKIKMVKKPSRSEFASYYFDPSETRKLFRERGWRRIVGFQTRNPVHRAHEYIQKCALEIADGLFLHPLVGETKEDDIPAEIRMKCYEALIKNYYPQDRAFLAVLPAAMRYAGPREAIFHAIVRKNYGCTHFIVGRDHAGVGDYYGSFDAHYIFDEFVPEELEIVPLFFDYTFFCRLCDGMVSYKTCPHDSFNHISLSGTKVREMLRTGEELPTEFTRPEVAEVLKKWATKQYDYQI